MLSLKLFNFNSVNIFFHICNFQTWEVLGSAHRLATKILKLMVTFQCKCKFGNLCNDQNSEI